VLGCKLAEAEAARSFAEEEAARARGAAAQLEARLASFSSTPNPTLALTSSASPWLVHPHP
jgi:hypothetical protein